MTHMPSVMFSLNNLLVRNILFREGDFFYMFDRALGNMCVVFSLETLKTTFKVMKS